MRIRQTARVWNIGFRRLQQSNGRGDDSSTGVIPELMKSTLGLKTTGRDFRFPSKGSSCARLTLGSVAEFDGRWWLVHTKPRNEKALSRDLHRMGINHFLPLTTMHRRSAGRSLSTQVPLFTGYLFLCGSEEDRYSTLRTGRTAGVLGIIEQERIRGELKSIEQLTQSGEPLDVFPAIQTGRRCRVTRGSLEGLEGVVLMRRGQSRVYVAVDILGQSAEVEIDPAMLESLE